MEQKVSPGATVSLVREDGRNFRFLLVPPTEADVSQGELSVTAPLGRALLGRREGEEFNFDAPGGRVRMKVLEIHPTPG